MLETLVGVVGAIAVTGVGWGIAVEYRLGATSTMSLRLDRLERKIDSILERLCRVE
jgi:hypothetical protein